MSKLSLTEATMLALQGKLPVKENKSTKRTKRLKKENIDINVDEKTNVSVIDNSTIVDTEDATIIVDKKDDIDTVEVPVDSNDTIIPEDLPETDDMTSDILPDDDNMPIAEPTQETDIVDDIDLPLDNATMEIADDENKEESKIIESKEQVSKGQVPDEAYAIAGYICGMYNGEPTITKEQFDEAFEEAKSKIISDDFEDDDLEAEVRGILSFEGWGTNFETGDLETDTTNIDENKKTESVEIEVSDDGTEVEVTTDNGEEVEVKDETPDEDTDETDTEIDQNEENIENIENIEENKKLQETTGYEAGVCPKCSSDNLTYGPVSTYTDSMEYPFKCNDCGATGKEIYDITYVESETDDLKENKKIENKKLQEDIEAAPFRNMIMQSLTDNIDEPAEIAERLAKAMSDDDCKWYCETYELVEILDNATNDRYYKDLWGNIRDISGQIVDDDSDLEEAKHRKIESLKKIEKRIQKNKKVEKNIRTFSNSNKKVERNTIIKCDLKSFNEALTKTLLKTNAKLESVELLKAVQVNDKLKMEAKLNMIDKSNKTICLEMKQNQINNKFTKYNLIKENKNSNLNLTMLTYKNKDNILECRYINKI